VAKELPMTRHKIPKVRQRNHIVTLREEEVPNEDRVVVETLFLEKEEDIQEER
jgi:hypothetical protein